MRVFAIGDPHLSRAQPKPMDVFGPAWQGHPEIFFERWRDAVGDGDVVLVPGDVSWAMRLEEALADLHDLAELPGRKVMIRGNHDYWWPSISKLRASLPEGMYALQNDAMELGGVVVSGTRGWVCPGSHGFDGQDEKIYLRELERLRLSLAAAKKLGGRRHVVMLHFPPKNSKNEPCGFSELLEEARPDAVVFGHVHGEMVDQSIEGVDVHFVAADAIGFRPRLIFEE